LKYHVIPGPQWGEAEKPCAGLRTKRRVAIDECANLKEEDSSELIN